MGVMYTNAQGVSPKIAKKPKNGSEKRPSKEFAEAQFNMGVLYINAQGVPHDCERSRKMVPKSGRAKACRSSI